jgi:disulfide oxidoreductase YuzD
MNSTESFLPSDEVSHDEPSNSVSTNIIAMTGSVLVEIVGLKNAECCPFPCDENRTCGLSGCYPTGKLNEAFDELKQVLKKEYGDRVDLKLTLIDNGAPDYIQKIIEKEFPPLPIILVNGRVTRIGRISLDRIKKEIEKEC